VSEEEGSEKTEDPTPERRRKAREEGNLARSKDAGAVAATLSVLLLLATMGPLGYLRYRAFAEDCFRVIGASNGRALDAALNGLLPTLLTLTLPVALAAALGAIVIGTAETGLYVNWSLIEPKWSRLDPVSRFPTLFAPGPAVAMTILTLLRVAAVFWVTYDIIESESTTLAKIPRMPLEQGVAVSLGILGRIAVWATGTLALMSALDYGYSFWKREKSLKMSRQELKDEMHQQEGDPRVKSRQRQRAREMLKRNIVQEVKGADVVVANPTHVAVALRYRPDEGAPMVVAKGLDEIAQYIKKVAKDHDVPVVESVQLARALHAQVKVGRRIPLEFFQTVAEILAYVYRLKRRGLRA
jgi:flagellar biosynthesis protein FlhB